MTAKRFQLDPETLDLLQVIESTDEEDRRSSAIFNLARKGGMNGARILIEAFQRSMWRSTKFSIIQALGLIRHERATEFLCQIAIATDDLTMAAEAVLALGSADNPVAGEFLTSILRTPNHPLMRESLIALGQLNFFPCEQEIISIIRAEQSETPTSVLQNAVITAGLRGYKSQLKFVIDLLHTQSSGPLFNTALMTIGRIGDSSSLTALESLDTRYRAFAHQLKISAMDHLRLRLRYTIEDAIGAALDAKSPATMRQAWHVLSSFSDDSVREAIQLLVVDAPLDFQVLERVVLFNKNHVDDDFKFLTKNIDSIRDDLFAALIRLHVGHMSRDRLGTILGELGDEFKLRVLSLVRIEKGWEILIDLISSAKVLPGIKLRAINALILQSLMFGLRPDICEVIAKRIIKLVEIEGDPIISGRLVRAIGQLRYFGPDAANLLRERLKSGGLGVEGVYSALALCDTDESTRMITKRLRQLIASNDSESEVRSAIHGLARCSNVSDASSLAQLPKSSLSDLRVAVLKILCTSQVRELTSFVTECLVEKDFQTKLLAVVAAKLHQSPENWRILFELLDHDNVSLSGRALDTIATTGGAAEHLQLMKRLEDRPDDQAAYAKVLRSLSPKSGESYQQVSALVNRLIQQRKGVMADQDLMLAAINLKDNLALLGAGFGDDIPLKRGLLNKEKHQIDGDLARTLRGFERYSETIKSVLRSGEVTWQHPELFDATVDKSTVLVQYVKAIDLLLQEKIGSAMFLGQGAEFLQKMQSRVVRLELDDDSGFGGNLVTDLDCSLYFSRDSFPAHKLSLLCRSVMSGLIMKEQYRVVDGLRAWALLLLLFGRTFKFRGQLMEPLFTLSKSTTDSICRVARAMNDLQDIRNRAAHRGTMLELENMKEARDLSAALLNDLHTHLG